MDILSRQKNYLQLVATRFPSIVTSRMFDNTFYFTIDEASRQFFAGSQIRGMFDNLAIFQG